MSVPEFPIEDAEDAYTFYVVLIGLPESLFWDADLPFLASVVANKTAYDRWANAVTDALREEE